ncbi:MAG: aminotransferase [Sphingomonadales bacterium]
MATQALNSTTDWQTRDTAHYLHPFTDHAALHSEGARILTHAEGIYHWDSDGNKVLDGLAGLGCVNIGYGRQELALAAQQAMSDLSMCQSFFKTSNQQAIALAEVLAEITPEGLNHAFFQSSGSEANETAIRLALHYWALEGMPGKRNVIARENASHGSTMLTANSSGIPPKAGAGSWDFEHIHHIPAPYKYLHGPDMSEEAFAATAAQWLEDKILQLGPDTVAVFIAEPFQGAGGAIIPPEGYWPRVQAICKKYDVLLAIDEVVCGFGRSGHWFGSQSFDIEGMDILQMAKGLTSAYAPLSATMVSDRLANTLIEKGGEWWHGFTYSGHPMCCAVALENIRILKKEGIVEQVRKQTGPYFKDHMMALADHPLVGDVRARGLFGGIQLVKDKASRTLFGDEEPIGEQVSAAALERGLALRDIGNTNALMPPLIISKDELDFTFSVTRLALDETARTLGLL